MRAVDFRQCAVEGSQWKVSGFAGQFEYQTVRKSEVRSLSIVLKSRSDHVGVLQGQLFVFE